MGIVDTILELIVAYLLFFLLRSRWYGLIYDLEMGIALKNTIKGNALKNKGDNLKEKE